MGFASLHPPYGLRRVGLQWICSMDKVAKLGALLAEEEQVLT